MRSIILFILVLFLNAVSAQQVISIGETGSQTVNTKNTGIVNDGTVPDIKLTGLLNAGKSEISLHELKGKIVILEFWATWCGPCLPALDHLYELKKKFPGQLEVIAISDESTERIRRFIKNKPSSIWFATDLKQSMQQYFPFHAIPHSVIIDQNGKLVANTNPVEITENVIKTILNRQKISVKEKKMYPGVLISQKTIFLSRPALMSIPLKYSLRCPEVSPSQDEQHQQVNGMAEELPC